MGNTSKDENSAKCFSGIFRRLLCSGSLPTHPSDQFTESKIKKFDPPENVFKSEVNVKVASNSPGIVARLMGLDSLPETTLGSFLRTRSVNSLDNYFPQFDLAQQFHHRRVKTSVSFREISTFDLEKPQFFVLSFDDEEEKEGFIIKKSKLGNQEMKLKKSCNCNRSMNMTKNVMVMKTSSEVSSQKKKDVCRKQNVNVKVRKAVKAEDCTRKVSVESKLEKKKKQRNKNRHVVVSNRIQPLFNLEDSSPMHLQAAMLDNSGKLELINPTKSPPKATNHQYPNYAITGNVGESNEMNKEVDYYIKTIGQICRLAEEDVKECYWVATTSTTGGSFKFDYLHDLIFHFEQHVVELLLDQVVKELLIPSPKIQLL